MKKMSQHTWEIWFLGSIFGCIVPMLAVMCESRDPQVMKYATITLIVSFISFMGSVIVGTKNDTEL